jgi:hypothetical protein
MTIEFDPVPYTGAAHVEAQQRCHCVIHRAVDGAKVGRVVDALNHARRVNDPAALPILLLQLGGPCCLPAVPDSDELARLRANADHA